MMNSEENKLDSLQRAMHPFVYLPTVAVPDSIHGNLQLLSLALYSSHTHMHAQGLKW